MASQCGWWDICAVVPQGTRVDEDSADLFSPRQGRKRARDDRLSPGSSRQRRKVVHYEIDSLYDLISTWHYLDADIVQDARTHRVQLGNRMSNIQQEYVLDTRMRILKHFGNLFMRKKEYVCEELDKVSSMVRVDGGEVICRSEKRECSIAAYWSCRQRERESRSWEEDSSGAMKPGLGSRFFGTRDPFRGINTSRDTHDFSFACLPRLSPVFYLPSYICDTCHLLSVRKEGVDQLHDLHWAVLLRANLRKDMEFVNGVLQTATLGGGYWAVQDVEKAKSYAVKSLTLAKKMENQRQVIVSYIYLGYYNISKGNYRAGLYVFYKAYLEAEKMSESQIKSMARSSLFHWKQKHQAAGGQEADEEKEQAAVEEMWELDSNLRLSQEEMEKLPTVLEMATMEWTREHRAHQPILF